MVPLNSLSAYRCCHQAPVPTCSCWSVICKCCLLHCSCVCSPAVCCTRDTTLEHLTMQFVFGHNILECGRQGPQISKSMFASVEHRPFTLYSFSRSRYGQHRG